MYLFKAKFLTKISYLRYKIPMKFKIEDSWNGVLGTEFKKPYMKELVSFLEEEKSQGKIIYPAEENIFEAFRLTPFSQVKVVILGQDPYHGPGQAHGLCFSVQRGIKHPPSLQNIFKELRDDQNIPVPDHGCLESWAQQGVLLINSVMTVEQGKANAHVNKGWETFTDRVIEVLNQEKEHLVFMLWGTPAQKKAKHVDPKRHLLLKSVHPSPLSVYRGFYGSKHFSQANTYLNTHGLGPVDWSIKN